MISKYKKYLLGILFLLFVVIFALIYFLARKDNRENPGKTLKYFEIVKEDSSCRNSCFWEYIVTSKGDVMEKKIIDFNRSESTLLNMYRIDTETAERLFKDIDDYFVKYANIFGIECDECAVYHIYYDDGKKTKAYSVREENAPVEIENIMKTIAPALKQTGGNEDEFIHFYYGKRDQSYVDFHIFSSGIVIKEIFGKKNGELLTSNIYEISANKFNEALGIIKGDFFRESGGTIKCSRKDYVWGFLEVKMEGKYNNMYTCGEGKNNSDEIFKYLYSNYE